jgi:hypothetical protein
MEGVGMKSGWFERPRASSVLYVLDPAVEWKREGGCDYPQQTWHAVCPRSIQTRTFLMLISSGNVLYQMW